MSPNSEKDVFKIFKTFKDQKHNTKNTTVVFCPPFVFLKTLKDIYMGSKIFFGAQDVFFRKEGSHTGEISTEMLKSFKVRFVITGHSERRALGENNQMVLEKTKLSLKEGFHTVLCIGEPDRDVHGNYLHFIKEQIMESLQSVTKPLTKKLIVAYEPIWAIGKGKKAITPDELHRMTLYIKKVLIDKYGTKIGSQIPILYGGSVNSENAKSIITEGEVDGLLVGRASLNPYEFSKIINNINKK